jgi:heme A synthase
MKIDYVLVLLAYLAAVAVAYWVFIYHGKQATKPGKLIRWALFLVVVIVPFLYALGLYTMIEDDGLTPPF